MDFGSIHINNMSEKIRDDLKLNLHNSVNIPKDINISTMTMQAKFDTTFIPWNIYMYIDRNPENIIKVTIKNNNNREKRTKKKSEFLNQVTVRVKVSNKRNNMPISVKIFRNGTLHFTGCQSVENMLEVAHKICIECKKTRAIIKDGTIKEIQFAKNTEALCVEKMHSFKVDMINSNFYVPFEINRPNLYTILKKDKYNVCYDSNKHAAVNLTYKKGVTIFIFESGSVIIIVGNNGIEPVVQGYNFIYKYLLENYMEIVKDDTFAATMQES